MALPIPFPAAVAPPPVVTIEDKTWDDLLNELRPRLAREVNLADSSRVVEAPATVMSATL